MTSAASPTNFAAMFLRLLPFVLACALLGGTLLQVPWLFGLGGGLLFFAAVSASAFIGDALPWPARFGLMLGNMLLIGIPTLTLLTVGDPSLLDQHSGGASLIGTLAFFVGWLCAYHTLRLLTPRLRLPALKESP